MRGLLREVWFVLLREVCQPRVLGSWCVHPMQTISFNSYKTRICSSNHILQGSSYLRETDLSQLHQKVS